MAKLPIKPVVKVVKEALPKVKDYVQKNPDGALKVVTGAAGAAGAFGKKILDSKQARFEQKKLKGKVHPRKLKYREFHNNILPNLDSFSYAQLNKYKHEVENYLKQINREENRELVLKQPIHSKRLKGWNIILEQLEDFIFAKNYEELLKAANNLEYVSPYFEPKIIEKLRESKNESLISMVHGYTKKEKRDIERDFI